MPAEPLSRLAETHGQLVAKVAAIFDGYNEHRPPMGLAGKTPNEVYRRLRPANRRPRVGPRKRWPSGSPCVRPCTLVAGQAGGQFQVCVAFQAG